VFPALLVAAALVFTSIVDIPWSGGIGDKRWEIAEARNLRDTYELGIGEATLDLRDLDLTGTEASTTLSTEVNVGIGHLLVLVPRGTSIEIDGEVGMGDADVVGHPDDGVNVELHRTIHGDEDHGTIQLDLHLGIGHLEVREAA
jgi:predicted membrane protein